MLSLLSRSLAASNPSSLNINTNGLARRDRVDAAHICQTDSEFSPVSQPCIKVQVSFVPPQGPLRRGSIVPARSPVLSRSWSSQATERPWNPPAERRRSIDEGILLDMITHATRGVSLMPFSSYPNYFHPQPGINDDNDERTVYLRPDWGLGNLNHHSTDNLQAAAHHWNPAVKAKSIAYAPPRGGTSGREQRSKCPQQTNNSCGKKKPL
ncbi:uncharacterized protein NECHADRAFT_84097 [Fusarium vanettenii 77-13-4]|uniref:Uncharacterized protein n=1 Tax=Fusarium vanettenii (strain ATCC MYA-4622 / CBS 123669 / FGSC 9596 / NRRL 45880 / 77-13-4) TaxID=660122 RepID=C7YZP3_FUSV7|nr:uncharacterized protein NECHADRAFT_84097 [Fusarium vanettenii 77-13-4]EEU42642.1 predicted protein [Fusarium vanettenii 77-13-4]